jgi:hypothetical protein
LQGRFGEYWFLSAFAAENLINFQKN